MFGGEVMIALLTPTGGRKQQLHFLYQYMSKQTFQGDVVWILIDDVAPSSIDFIPDSFRPNWTIIKVRPSPCWCLNSYPTIRRNLREGFDSLSTFKIDMLLFIEDDDWYHPSYIQEMWDRSVGFDIIGQRNTMYYNVVNKSSKICPNVNHSSLFQTGVKSEFFPMLHDILKKSPRKERRYFIDLEIWKSRVRKNLFSVNGDLLSLGIKGMPGRNGIGSGHKINTYTPNSCNLFDLIGEDSKNYENQ